MLARLDAAFDSQRRFVANASHELRTPLSVIRTEVDVTLGDPGAPIAELRTMGEVVREASMRADRLVDALLVLARSDGQARQGLAQREPIDLASLVPAAVAAVALEASARGLAVSTETRPAPVEGDPELLERLVGNLVENAVRHNVDGGWVTVRTGTESGAFLSVLNTGPAVPAGEVDELFQPFRRGGTARTGSRGAGLGLSIVRAVAAAHGGAVSGPAPPRAPVPVCPHPPPIGRITRRRRPSRVRGGTSSSPLPVSRSAGGVGREGREAVPSPPPVSTVRRGVQAGGSGGGATGADWNNGPRVAPVRDG